MTSENCDLSDINLHNDAHSEVNSLGTNSVQKRNKVPRRVLHFSDGTMEEYSTDEEETQKKTETDELDSVKKTHLELLSADPKSLYWSSWFWFHILTVGTTTLSMCDFLGERLASFFGITTPKYEYEIDFYNTMKAEEEEQMKQQDLEMGGWSQSNRNANDSVTTPKTDSNEIISAKESTRY